MAILKMTEKHKLMAYVLHTEFNYTKTSIAQLMGVAQSTISAAIKDVEYQKVIFGLQNELSGVSKEIALLGYQQPVTIPHYNGN